MQRDGMTFRQFLVSDSLCCSSRATILTGSFPHNTRVLGNTPPLGGYRAFRRFGARERSVAIALQRAGYRTALMGKYLNGYQPDRTGADPGWDEWLGIELRVQRLRLPDVRQRPAGGRRIPAARLHDRRARPPRGDVRPRQSAGRRPFFLTISAVRAAQALHAGAAAPGAVPAICGCRRGVASTRGRQHPPAGSGRGARLGPRPASRGCCTGVPEARAVGAGGRRAGRSASAPRCARRGCAGRTYVVFGSDNGYHLGQHRLMAGQADAFDHDVRVPLSWSARVCGGARDVGAERDRRSGPDVRGLGAGCTARPAARRPHAARRCSAAGPPRGGGATLLIEHTHPVS